MVTKNPRRLLLYFTGKNISLPERKCDSVQWLPYGNKNSEPTISPTEKLIQFCVKYLHWRFHRWKDCNNCCSWPASGRWKRWCWCICTFMNWKPQSWMHASNYLKMLKELTYWFVGKWDSRPYKFAMVANRIRKWSPRLPTFLWPSRKRKIYRSYHFTHGLSMQENESIQRFCKI